MYTSSPAANKLIKACLYGAITRDELLWELRYEIQLPESVIRDLTRNVV